MNADHRLKPTIHHLIRDLAVYGTGDLILRGVAFLPCQFIPAFSVLSNMVFGAS